MRYDSDRDLTATTAGQLVNFGVFMCALVLSVNVYFGLREQMVLWRHLDDDFTIIAHTMSGGACLMVAFLTFRSPFDMKPHEQHESLLTHVYLVCLLAASLAPVVDDAELLFNGIVEASGGQTEGSLFADLVPTTDPLLLSIGGEFVRFSAISKLVLAATSVFYFYRAVTDGPPLRWPPVIRRGRIRGVGALVFLFVTAFWGQTAVTDIGGDGWGTSNPNANALFADEGPLLRLVVDPHFTAALHHSASGALLGLALYLLAFYEHFEFAASSLFVVLVFSVVRAGSQGEGGALLAIAVVVSPLLGALVPLTASRVAVSSYPRVERPRIVVRALASLAFKVGAMFSIAALIFSVVAFTNDWREFRFDPSGVALESSLRLDQAAANMDDIVDKVTAVARKLDPCVRRASEDVPTDIDYAGDTAGIDELMVSTRRGIFEDPSSLDQVCINNDALYTVKTSPARCPTLAASLEDRRDLMVIDVNNADYALDEPYIVGSELDDNFISPVCRDRQCNALLGLVVAGAAVSAVPFFGAVGFAMATAARASFAVFRVGRSIARFGPRMRRSGSKIKNLAKRIRKLIVSTRGASKLTAAVAVLFAPLVVGGTVALSLVMFRRSVYSGKAEGPASVRDTSLKLAVGVLAPLLVANTAFTAVVFMTPRLVDGILAGLPGALVRVTVQEGSGYAALKAGYVFGTVGVALMLGALLVVGVEETVVDRVAKSYFFRGDASTAPGTRAERLQRVLQRILTRLLSANNAMLQPVIFSLPAVYLLLSHITSDRPYVEVGYLANDDVARTSSELSVSVAQQERSESIGMGMDDTECGLVGRIVNRILESVALEDVKEALNVFSGYIKDGLAEAGDFIGQLNDIIEIPFTAIVIDTGVPTFLANMLIYAIPAACTTAIVLRWIQTYNQRNDPGSVDNSPLVGLVVGMSVTNIMLHIVVGRIISSLETFSFPFVKLSVTLGEDHYMTQLCSMFNLMSAVVLYINGIAPPA
jgi:hypothetical protein